MSVDPVALEHPKLILPAGFGEQIESAEMAAPRLMLDPSFLFSADAIAWLEGDEVERQGIVVPATFLYWLTSGRPDGDRELLSLVAPDDREAYSDRREQLIYLLDGVEPFRADSVRLEPPGAEVLTSILEMGGMASTIWSEEWAFLESNSWALSKLHRPLDVFRDAGAAIVEYGRKLRDEMISMVMPHEPMPSVVTPGLLATVAAKWLIVGGPGVGALFFPPVGAGSFAAAAVVRAFDP